MLAALLGHAVDCRHQPLADAASLEVVDDADSEARVTVSSLVRVPDVPNHLLAAAIIAEGAHMGRVVRMELARDSGYVVGGEFVGVVFRACSRRQPVEIRLDLGDIVVLERADGEVTESLQCCGSWAHLGDSVQRSLGTRTLSNRSVRRFGLMRICHRVFSPVTSRVAST